MRPTYYKQYNSSVPYETRVSQLLAWLDLPAHERPHFMTMYLEQPDKAGHRYGPEADEVLNLGLKPKKCINMYLKEALV